MHTTAQRSVFAIAIAGAALISAVVAADAADDNASRSAADAAFKHHDGAADGKKSLGGSGDLIRFTLPQDKQKIAGIKIHGSRYGVAQPPKEKFLIYFLSADGTEILSTQMAPYSAFNRGDEQWVTVRFLKPVEASTDFWLCIDFRAQQTKGVYVSYDTSTGGKFSRSGLPGIESNEVEFGGDWMIELVPAK